MLSPSYIYRGLLTFALIAMTCPVGAQMLDGFTSEEQTLQAKTPAQQSTAPQKANGYQVRTTGTQVSTNKKNYIFLYLEDFKILRTIHGDPNCTMKFYVWSTAEDKLTNISYRLKWPSLETQVAFDGVNPNKPTYLQYSLFGKGCYEMDKAPNVTIHRCRLRGKTQQECAAMVQWVQ